VQRYGVKYQDDIVTAAAIATITNRVYCFWSWIFFNFATLSNAADIKTIDKPWSTTIRSASY
jgi:hypothetical protein